MNLLIFIPALNEAASIGDVLDGIPSRIEGVDAMRVLVIDDGSTDGTGRLAAEHGAAVIRHDRPRGVGAAFRSGLAHAVRHDADLIVTLDADGQFNPADIPALLAPILADEADFATASRFKDPAFEPHMPYAKRWGNRVIARWLSRMTGSVFRDVSCGFRAYSRAAALRLNPRGDFTYTHEVFLCLAFAGLRIREVPVHVRGVREHGRSRVAANLPRYAWRAAAIILATYRDYQPFAFFGKIAFLLAAIGSALALFLIAHWARTGGFTPFKFTGFLAAAFGGAALIVFLAGLVAAMLARIRQGVETALVRIGDLESRLNAGLKAASDASTTDPT